MVEAALTQAYNQGLLIEEDEISGEIAIDLSYDGRERILEYGVMQTATAQNPSGEDFSLEFGIIIETSYPVIEGGVAGLVALEPQERTYGYLRIDEIICFETDGTFERFQGRDARAHGIVPDGTELADGLANIVAYMHEREE